MADDFIPKRSNLVEESVRAMIARIEAGEWTKTLPGERVLAKRLQVGRDTIRLMLVALEQQGYLLPAEPGKARKLAEKAQWKGRLDDHSGPKRVGVLAPQRLEKMSQPVLLEIDQVREALAARGIELTLQSPYWYQQMDPSGPLTELTENAGCQVWMLFRASAAVQKWFADSGVPCLVRGYLHDEVELPFMDVDWEATARHAAGRLWRLGHRRVGVLVPEDGLRGVNAALAGARSIQEAGFEILEMPEDGTPEGLSRCLERGLRTSQPPTALMALRSRQVAGGLSWLAQHRIRVPQEISLISLAHESYLDHLFPTISGYSVNQEQIAKRVVRKLELLSRVGKGMSSSMASWIEPDAIEGRSIGPPPGFAAP